MGILTKTPETSIWRTGICMLLSSFPFWPCGMAYMISVHQQGLNLGHICEARGLASRPPGNSIFQSFNSWTWFFPPLCVLSSFSRVQLFTTLWMVAHQAPLSTESSRQEYWGGLPCPVSWPRDRPCISYVSWLAGGLFTSSSNLGIFLNVFQ